MSDFLVPRERDKIATKSQEQLVALRKSESKSKRVKGKEKKKRRRVTKRKGQLTV